MSQTWTDNVYAPDHVGHTDLTNMEDMFNTLRTMFSGGSTPGMGFGYDTGLPWFNTSAGSGNNKKVFNIYDGSAWRGMMHGRIGADVMKMWVYSDTALDGWLVDSVTAVDKVLAFKGGEYGGAGGALVGTWDQVNHVHSGPNHRHTGPNHRHGVPIGRMASGQVAWKFGQSSGTFVADHAMGLASPYGPTVSKMVSDYSGTGNTGYGGTGNTGGGKTLTTWRPHAAVGTLQYLDIN